jgi:exodeoxyribonuclease VII small subunit
MQRDGKEKTAKEGESSFDERLARLEGIVGELEGGGLPLEQAIERYQEGVALLKGCHGSLAGFRKQVEELTSDAAGTLRSFEGDPDEGGAS